MGESGQEAKGAAGALGRVTVPTAGRTEEAWQARRREVRRVSEASAHPPRNNHRCNRV